MPGKCLIVMGAALLCAGLPVFAGAESDESAGVVTTVNGDATLTRVARLAKPVSLRMRDEIFVRDRIQTQPHSLVRVLLGGKALITVRELSILTVTEEASRVTVDLQSGKVGVAVVKSRMRPGEVIEIRSPNATAAVRGTVFVVDVDPVPPGKSAAASTTRVHLFQGALDVSARHGAAQPPVRLAAMQSIVIAGNSLGAARPLSREMVAALTADLKPRQIQDTDTAPSEFTGQLVAREQGRALLLASTLLPAGGPLGPAPLKNVKGTVKGVTGTVKNVTEALTGGLGETVTNLTGTTAETLERLMDTLGIGNEGLVGGVAGAVDDLGHAAGNTVSGLGSTLGNTVDGVGNTLGNALGGGPAAPAVATSTAPPVATPVAPPIVTPVAPPIVGPVAPPILNPLTPVLSPIVNPLVNVLGGKK
jgi:hypothetical protein